MMTDKQTAYQSRLRKYYFDMLRRKQFGLSGAPSEEEVEAFLNRLRQLVNGESVELQLAG